MMPANSQGHIQRGGTTGLYVFFLVGGCAENLRKIQLIVRCEGQSL